MLIPWLLHDHIDVGTVLLSLMHCEQLVIFRVVILAVATIVSIAHIQLALAQVGELATASRKVLLGALDSPLVVQSPPTNALLFLRVR